MTSETSERTVDPRDPANRRAVTLAARASRLVLGWVGGLTALLRARRVPAPRAAAWTLLAAIASCSALAFGLSLRAPTVGSAPVARAERLLKVGRSCVERRDAARELIATGDRRYLAALEAARDRRGGLVGSEAANGCMRDELGGAIARLRASPSAGGAR